jgi:membrane protein implicated in regulation of membrane protease activity
VNAPLKRKTPPRGGASHLFGNQRLAVLLVFLLLIALLATLAGLLLLLLLATLLAATLLLTALLATLLLLLLILVLIVLVHCRLQIWKRPDGRLRKERGRATLRSPLRFELEPVDRERGVLRRLVAG